MATFSKVGEFNSSVETMSAYLEKVELYLTVNAVSSDKRVAVLLSWIGSPTYILLRSLTHLDLPATKMWDQLKKLLMEYFEPKPLVIAERFFFTGKTRPKVSHCQEYFTRAQTVVSHMCIWGVSERVAA